MAKQPIGRLIRTFLRRLPFTLVVGMTALFVASAGLSGGVVHLRVVPTYAWLLTLLPGAFAILLLLARLLRPIQVAWIWVALAISVFGLLAQLPRSAEVTIEVHSVGKLSLQVENPGEEETLMTGVQSDLILLPVTQEDPERGVFSVSMPAHFPNEDRLEAVERPPDAVITFLRRQWLSDMETDLPFRVGVAETRGELELSLEMQLQEGLSDTLGQGRITWRQSDGLEQLIAGVHNSFSVYRNQTADFIVTRGPVALVPLTEFGNSAIITHKSDNPVHYISLENFETAGPSRLIWWEDMTESLLAQEARDQLRVWKELGLARPIDTEYSRCINYGPTYGWPFLIVGEGCRLDVDGETVYRIDEPFVAILVSDSHWLCFRTWGVPYVSAVDVLRNPACECAAVWFDRRIDKSSLPVHLILEECTGVVKIGKGAASVPFEEYDTVTVDVAKPVFEPRVNRPGEYVLAVKSGNVWLNEERVLISAWDYWPSTAHWAVYGVLAFLWLPILQKLRDYVWKDSEQRPRDSSS